MTCPAPRPLHLPPLVIALVMGGLVLPAGCGRSAAPPVAPEPEDRADEVNVGYGSRARENVTGSVSSISGDELDRPRAATMERLLRGRIPGLQVIRLPNRELSLWVRGMGSKTGRPPHVVIDGAPYTVRDLLAMDPGVVERVDVLKDAGAAVYGLRGANGVILITTKRR